MDPDREIVLGIGPEPHLRWRRYGDAVLALIRSLALRRVVLLGAYLADVVYSRPVGVTGFASDPRLLDPSSVAPSHYDGPTGIVGVLGDRLRAEGIEFTSLWAGIPHYIAASPNPRGALALLERVGPLIGLRLDLEPLRAEAARFEEKVSALVAADPDLGEYVRQLKRRDFAQ
jgi:predicted ATP-grasp superfamily ATP-dependent carboligase